MAIQLKPVAEQVIVITGASSGIGLATARAAAEQGAQLVLTSRNDECLAEIEQQINAAGGRAIHVVADVAHREELEKVADAAIEHFGGFDTWINNAGQSIWGRLEEVSDDDHRRLFDTNFWGIVYGSLIAVDHLKRHGGALINLGSVASDLALPIQGMYSATKHAIKGFTDALRMELEEEGAPISVTLIKPSSINTPLPQRAKNYLDKEPQLPPPVYAPEEVAYAILYAAEHPERDVYIGGGGKALSSIQKYAPRAADWVGRKFIMPQSSRNQTAEEHEDALHHLGKDGQVQGNYPGHVWKHSFYTRASLHPFLTGTLFAIAAGAAATLFLNERSGSN